MNAAALLFDTLSRGLRVANSTTTSCAVPRGHSRARRPVFSSTITQTAQNSQYESWASSSRRDDARGQRGRGRAVVAPDDNSTYNQPELRRDDDEADHLAAVVAAKAIAVRAPVAASRE